MGVPLGIWRGGGKQMEAWSEGHIEALLCEGESVEVAFPVRYPFGKLPFSALFRGCVIALTNRRIIAYAYHRATSRPDREIWSGPRTAGCTAALSRGGRRLILTRSYGETHEFVVRRHPPEVQQFVSALN